MFGNTKSTCERTEKSALIRIRPPVSADPGQEAGTVTATLEARRDECLSLQKGCGKRPGVPHLLALKQRASVFALGTHAASCLTARLRCPPPPGSVGSWAPRTPQHICNTHTAQSHGPSRPQSSLATAPGDHLSPSGAQRRRPDPTRPVHSRTDPTGSPARSVGSEPASPQRAGGSGRGHSRTGSAPPPVSWVQLY